MDSTERKAFWDTLCSIRGNTPEQTQMLASAIKLPRSICRFRTVSESSLTQLQENKLYYSSADYYEQTILDRLASWYDRTIEQVIVTVQNENISPGQRIARGNDKYIVVSKAHNWRDGMVTLTMQKMYEQAQA